MAATGSRLVIQNTIKARLQTVPGVYNVYVDEIRTLDVQALVDAFQDDDDTAFLQTWILGRIASPNETNESTGGREVAIRSEVRWVHTFQLELWFGIKKDASEPVFQALIDAVLDSFVNQRSLGGFTTRKPLELTGIRNDQLRGLVACRVARFEVTVIDLVNGLTPV